MRKMIRCILGERKSGKSVFVENRIKETGQSALYIATLPDLERYQEKIKAHQIRRPQSWQCLELFQLTMGEILAFPYHDYRHVLLDNLSYYLLWQLYYNEEELLRTCDRRIFSFLDKMAAYEHTTFYIVDTPLQRDILEEDDKTGIIRRLFTKILGKAAVIERFVNDNTVYRMNLEEGKQYLLGI